MGNGVVQDLGALGQNNKTINDHHKNDVNNHTMMGNGVVGQK